MSTNFNTSWRTAYGGKYTITLIHGDGVGPELMEHVKAAIRNRLQQKELQEKASNSSKEEQDLKEKLNLLISYTKQLKEQVAKEISVKKCQNRRINIMGEINTL
ncbi:hypothetical protein I4U23_021702 [Adineta vaga]|nr:hypothetical protein I4U23_021702 [Adineta vaga]